MPFWWVYLRGIYSREGYVSEDFADNKDRICVFGGYFTSRRGWELTAGCCIKSSGNDKSGHVQAKIHDLIVMQLRGWGLMRSLRGSGL